jgi:phosphatidylserine/phosphatidylglycerophosphate/cardiolipin synthase-like enzyme
MTMRGVAEVEVYFNRPGAPLPIDRLLDDIRRAGERVVVASAWFTSRDVARALQWSNAGQKYAILSAGDLTRPGSREAAQLLRADPNVEVAVRGSADWQRGTMHHKFVVIDHRTVWTGSYNLTVQAGRNFETLLRIDDARVNARFWKEACHLLGLEPADAWAPNVCDTCGQALDWDEYFAPDPANGGTGPHTCILCAPVPPDPEVIKERPCAKCGEFYEIAAELEETDNFLCGQCNWVAFLAQGDGEAQSW